MKKAIYKIEIWQGKKTKHFDMSNLLYKLTVYLDDSLKTEYWGQDGYEVERATKKQLKKEWNFSESAQFYGEEVLGNNGFRKIAETKSRRA